MKNIRKTLSLGALAVLSSVGFGVRAAAAQQAAAPVGPGVGERSDEPIRTIVLGIRG